MGVVGRRWTKAARWRGTERCGSLGCDSEREGERKVGFGFIPVGQGGGVSAEQLRGAGGMGRTAGETPRTAAALRAERKRG